MGRLQDALYPLPIDVFLEIFYYLSIEDILNIRKTNRDFHALTHLRGVWYTILDTHILSQNIPLPSTVSLGPLETLSATELENLTFRALHLRKTWTSPSPKASRQIEWQPANGTQLRCVALRFLPGRGGRWLFSITAYMGSSPRMLVLQCWDVAASPTPALLAQRRVDRLTSWAINSDPDNVAIIALQFPETEILTVDFSAADPKFGFISLAVFPNKVREILTFSGSTLATRDTTETVYLWDIDTPEIEVGLQNPELSEPHICQAVILQYTFALVIRRSTFEIYPLFTYRSGPISLTHPVVPIILHPLAQHKWQWHIDSVAVAPTAPSPDYNAPINVFIRFGSWYPWPINILHHFVLSPDPSYTSSHLMSATNLPYGAQPRLVETLASPVRLFASSALALGPYGTAIWLDTHTEDYFGQSDHGQRLAARVLHPMTVDEGLSHGDSALAPGLSIPSIGAATTFAVRETDGWVKVDMDEEAGRVAIGSVDGGLTLLEYK